MSRTAGFASPEGTERYKERILFQKQFHPGHFRKSQGLWFSSLGIGSYLGEPDDATDALYAEALEEAVSSGINVIDSAVNYRCQRSERVFGKALKASIEAGKISRDEVIVCTKGGFLPFDGHYPPDARGYFRKTYLETGLIGTGDLAQDCHAMNPAYLEDQLNRSRGNLGLETLDIYYLHNPETQLAQAGRGEFIRRMRTAFEWAEKKVKEGAIRFYGTATWAGFRVPPADPQYLSLQEFNVLAREAGGAGHHFKAVQFPLNLAMPEAWVLTHQGYAVQEVSLLEAGSRLGMTLIASASLLQAQLTGPFPKEFQALFPGFEKSSQCALQFARSCPGIVTALVGMKRKNHVHENLETAKAAPFSPEELTQIFQKAD